MWVAVGVAALATLTPSLVETADMVKMVGSPTMLVVFMRC
jgi:hypothetical protein